MGFSEGLLNGFNTVNNAIMNWQQLKDRKEMRDHELEREAINDRRYDDERQHAMRREQVADEQWNKKFDMADRNANRDYDLNQMKVNNDIKFNQSKLNLAAQNQYFNQNFTVQQEQYQRQQIENKKLTEAIQNAAMKGDSNTVNVLMAKLEKQDPNNILVSLKNNPKQVPDLFNAGGEIFKAFSEAKSPAEFAARAGEDGSLKDALNKFHYDYWNQNAGKPGKNGKIIDHSEFSAFAPMPEDPKDKENGKSSPGRFAVLLKVTYKDGTTDIVPMTQNRTASGDDPVKIFNVEDFFTGTKNRFDGLDQLSQAIANTVPQTTESASQGRSPYSARDLINAASKIRADSAGEYGTPTITIEEAYKKARELLTNNTYNPTSLQAAAQFGAPPEDSPQSQAQSTLENLSSNPDIKKLVGDNPFRRQALEGMVTYAAENGRLDELDLPMIKANIDRYAQELEKQHKIQMKKQDFNAFSNALQ